MHYCVVFRGDNYRDKHGISSALDCIGNWKESILNHIECDIVFITYKSPILDELVEIMKPIHIETSGYNCQLTNAFAAVRWMTQHKDNYDRFLLLRFDMMYRIKVTEWPKWDKKGIILVNKDINYPSCKYYADMVFIIDKGWIGRFSKALHSKNPMCLHHIGRDLENMKIPFHLMYKDYYHDKSHPLNAWNPVNKKPDLNNNDFTPTKVLTTNKWAYFGSLKGPQDD